LRDLLELSTKQAKKLIDDIADIKAPVFVMTGGDPLKRPDIFELVSYCRDRGVRASLTPSATPLLTKDAIIELKDAGLARLAISLDGSTPQLHDKFRKVDGSYDCTLNAVRWAREIGLPVQINTTITRHNLDDFDSSRTDGNSRHHSVECVFPCPHWARLIYRPDHGRGV
jgi:MoaA/NifB/PqqE/SkfB family radical SAM enzyme